MLQEIRDFRRMLHWAIVAHVLLLIGFMVFFLCL